MASAIERLTSDGWRPPAPAAPTPLATPTRVNTVIAIVFGIMAASWPFEMPNRTFSFEVPTMTTTLLLAVTVLQPLTCFGRIHAGILALATYVAAYGGLALFYGWTDTQFLKENFLFLLQALLMAWVTYNLMQHESLARRVLWVYVAACVVRTALPMTGLVEQTVITSESLGAARVTAFGQDPNFSAMLLAAAVIISLGLAFGPRPVSLRTKGLALLVAAFLGKAIVDTGSRGGLVALVGGILAFAVAKSPTPLHRIRRLAVMAVGLLALTYVVMNSYIMRKRIEMAAEEGSMAGREVLMPNLWAMFREKPILGWGPTNNNYEIVVRSGSDLWVKEGAVRKDTHNLYLELLTGTGLVGTIPFLLAMGLGVRAGWRARATDYGVVPLGLMLLFGLANVSLNQQAHKPFWFFMAFAMATEAHLAATARAARSRTTPGATCS